MNGFTDRVVRQALGANGRILPRSVPITAPDPWVTPGAGLDLEVHEVETPLAGHVGGAVADAFADERPPRGQTAVERPTRGQTAMERPAATMERYWSMARSI